MGVFGRLFKIGQAEAHSAIDKLEDPIKMTEQGIRDLKVSLDESLKAFAEVKALRIRSNKEYQENLAAGKSYERKAMALLQKAESGGIDPADADRLATEALSKKSENEATAATAKAQVDNLDSRISQLDKSVKKLKSQISTYENELKTLKARAKVSAATKKVNKQLSNIDSSGTVSMLERMKEKVDQDEALAEAYGDIAGSDTSIDDEIDSAIGGASGGGDALAALKAKMAGGA